MRIILIMIAVGLQAIYIGEECMSLKCDAINLYILHLDRTYEKQIIIYVCHSFAWVNRV